MSDTLLGHPIVFSLEGKTLPVTLGTFCALGSLDFEIVGADLVAVACGCGWRRTIPAKIAGSRVKFNPLHVAHARGAA